jgi:hypothetical protein
MLLSLFFAFASSFGGLRVVYKMSLAAGSLKSETE